MHRTKGGAVERPSPFPFPGRKPGRKIGRKNPLAIRPGFVLQGVPMQYRITPGGRVLSRTSGAGRPLSSATLARKVLGRGRPCRADSLAALAAVAVDAAKAADFLDALADAALALPGGHGLRADARPHVDRLRAFAGVVEKMKGGCK